MPEYLISFDQKWVGDHSEEWFISRGPLARAVVAEMKSAGVLIYAGGLVEELEAAISADATSGELVISDGPVEERANFMGGLTLIDVPDLEQAKFWAGKIAVACGWPQELREMKS